MSVFSVSLCAHVVSMQKLGAQLETEKRLQMLSAVKENDVSSHEQLSRLEEDIRQREMILAGYEKDNERLHNEMKRLQATNKAVEERMFHENHKLKTEVANLRSVSVRLMLYIMCIREVIKLVTVYSNIFSRLATMFNKSESESESE